MDMSSFHWRLCYKTLQMNARKLLALLIVMLHAPFAAAADDHETLIRRGVELRKQGKDEAALVYLQQAYDMAHTPRSAAQLGLCLSAVQRPLDAEARLNEALISTTDPWVNKQRKTLEEALQVVRSELATISFAAPSETWSVEVNGESRAAPNEAFSIYVAPGPVSVRVSAVGFEPYVVQRPVAKGETLNVNPTLKPATKPDLRADLLQGRPTEEPSRSGASLDLADRAGQANGEDKPFYRRGWFWVAAGVVAAAAVATAIVLTSSTTTEFTGISGQGPVVHGQ